MSKWEINMDNTLTEKQVRDIIKDELRTFQKKRLGFKTNYRMDSVVDVFSPITGNSSQIGFYGTTKKAKQTVTGSRGANAALASLLTALATIGLITDSSS